jgi:hypothetical protein
VRDRMDRSFCGLHDRRNFYLIKIQDL